MQDLARQIRELEKSGCDRVVIENLSDSKPEGRISYKNMRKQSS